MLAGNFIDNYIRGVGSARHPWDSDAREREENVGGNLVSISVRSVVSRYDSQEQIDFCTDHCPYPECCNCVVNSRRRTARRGAKNA